MIPEGSIWETLAGLGGLGFTLGANWLDGGAFDSFVGGQAVIRYAW